MKRLRSKSSLIVDLTRWDIFLTSLKIYFASQCYTLNFLKDSVKENEDKLISDTSLPLLVSTIAEIFFQGQNLKPGLKKKIVGIILKTSNRLSIYLKNSGFIKKKELRIYETLFSFLVHPFFHRKRKRANTEDLD